MQPGRGLGPYALGEKVMDSLTKLRASAAEIEVRYPQEPPLDAGIVVVDLLKGIELLFDCLSQRLVSITARNPCSAELTHKGVALSSGDTTNLPTFAKTYKLFGPTFPGQMMSERGGYVLSYPGVSFVFPIPAKYEALCREPDQLPLELPDGTTPVASRLTVHHASNDQESTNHVFAEPELVYCSAALGSIRLSSLDSAIQFGAAVQEVQCVLGPPDAVCHTPVGGVEAEAASVEAEASGYLYNYFELGLDLGFCGHTHTVNKFVFHSNQPGHRDFNQYHKCMFEIAVKDGKLIGSESLWGEVESILGKPIGGRPVINSAQSATSPFGSTKYYGFEHGLIVEVMDNGQLASVIMYRV